MIWAAVVLASAAVLYAAFGPGGKKEKPAAAPVAAAPQAPPAKPAPATPAARPATPPTGPRIEFATRNYDFGRAVGDDQVDCLFVFTNTGIATLELKEVSPGCGCMKAGEWTRKVEPGQIGTIPIRFDSRGFTGGFAKSVFVTCNDPADPKPMLQIKGQVWRPLEITPPSAVLNLTSETPSNAAAVRIISHMDEPLVLSDLASTASGLAIELQTNQPGREFQINVRTPPPFPTAGQQGHITIKSSVSNQPVLNIPLFVHVQQVIVAIPSQLRLPARQTNSFSTTTFIRNNGTNALVLSDVAVNAGGVTATISNDQGGRGATVSVAFPAGFEIAPGEKVELRGKTNHPQFPEIIVPISQLPPPNPAPTAAGTK